MKGKMRIEMPDYQNKIGSKATCLRVPISNGYAWFINKAKVY